MMNKEDNFPERIGFVIDKLNGPSELARQTGVTLSTIARWRKGEAEPSRPNLIKIADATGVSLQWLATGNDEKIYEGVKTIINSDVTMINGYSSINVSAGFGSFNEGVTKPDSEEPYADSLLAQLNVNPSKCAVFWANGNSMLPTIDSGDQLLVDLSKKEIKGNHIYLVQNEDCVWVKRVKMKWNSLELISDNKEEYEPIIISKDEAEHLQIIGQVVHIGHNLV